MWDPYAEFQSETLPNGLTIYASKWSKRSWEVIGFLIHSGAAQDPVGFEGTAHFVEHLVSQNANMPVIRIKEFFEDWGGDVNLGKTTYFGSSYNFCLPAEPKILAKAFSIFGYMLFKARLKRNIKKERQVVINEFHQIYPSTISAKIQRQKQKALYQGYYPERFITPCGDPESIKRISQDDLQSYYDKHYTPANISIVAVGGMDLSELISLLSESPFGINKKGQRAPILSPISDVKPPSEKQNIIELSKLLKEPVLKEIKTGQYRIFVKMPGNIDEDSLDILIEMLDELLYKEIREKRGWCYEVGCGSRNLGHFYEVSINCSFLPCETLKKIEKVINICIDSVQNSEELFNRIKRRRILRFNLLDPTGRSVCDNTLSDLEKKQRIDTLRDVKEGVEKVTMDDIENLLQWLQPKWRWTLIIQP